MRLIRVFIAHELLTQVRSLRFRVMAAVYVVASVAPVVLIYFARGFHPSLGSAAYAGAVSIGQPMLTTVLAAVLAVDGITRERDEGSLPVVGLAPASNGAYLLSRWIAIESLLLLLSCIPPLVACAFLMTTDAPLVASQFFWPWLLRIMPITVAVSAFALGIGTVTGGMLRGAGATFFLMIVVFGFGNDALARFGKVVTFPFDFLFGNQREINELAWVARGWSNPAWGTDAPYDVAGAIDRALPQIAILLGFSSVVLAAGTAFLRRTRPDVRPWRIREDHPLRTYLRGINRMREEYMPDPGLAATDAIFLLFGAGLAAGAVTFTTHRHTVFRGIADARYEAEKSGAPSPTPPGFVPTRWAVDAHLTGSGEVRSNAEIVMSNGGSTAVSHVAFMLNPRLSVSAVRGVGSGDRVTRQWDRIGIDFASPVEPNGERTFGFEIAGAPGHYILPVGNPFVPQFERMLNPEIFPDVQDFSMARVLRNASAQSIELRSTSLAPVPRYTPWTLTPRTGPHEGMQVPPERIAIACDVHVTIRAPQGKVLADSCGSIMGKGGLLTSNCRTDLVTYAVAGGTLSSVPIDDGAVALLFPVHVKLARDRIALLDRALTIARDAWPGIERPHRMYFVEQPSPEDASWWRWRPLDEMVSSRGAVVSLPETFFTTRENLPAERIAAAIIADRLRSSARIAAEENRFFVSFVGAVARRRMGGERAGAVVGPRIGVPDTDILLKGSQEYRERLRLVTADLEYRVGSDHLVEGINEFVAEHRNETGNAKELFAAIARRSGVSLDRFYNDLIAGQALPNLTMKRVRFVRSAARWEIDGTLQNLGTGEVFCPIVLRTDGGSQNLVLRIDSGQEIPFHFTAADQPRSVEMDPLKVCYRHAPVGTVSTVEYKGEVEAR